MEESELFLKLMDIGSTESVETEPMPGTFKAKLEPPDVDEENEEISDGQTPKHPFLWTPSQIEELVELVKSNYSLLLSRLVKRKLIWQKIHGQLNLPADVTYHKVEKKWKNMLYQYKRYVEGTPMRKPPYLRKMDTFLREANHATSQIEDTLESEANKTFWDESLNDEKSNSSATVSLPDESEEDRAEKKNVILTWSRPPTAKDQEMEKKTIAVASRSHNGLQFTKSLDNDDSLKRKLNSNGDDDDCKKKIKIFTSLIKPREDEKKNLELLNLLKDYRPQLKNKLINEKEMWEKIANRLNISPVEGAKRWRDMVLQWHKYVHRDKSESNLKEPMFFKKINSLVGESVFDGLIASSSRVNDSADLERSEEESSDEKEFSNTSSTEDEEPQTDKDSGDNLKKHKFWTYERTLELINLVKTYHVLLTDKRMKRRAVFEKILDEMEDPGKLTIDKVENKWRNLMYMHKRYLVNLNRDEHSGMREPLFFNEMNAILGKYEIIGDEVKLERISCEVDIPDPDERDASMSVNSCDPSLEQPEDESPKNNARLPDPTSSKTEKHKSSSLEQSLRDLVDLENRKFNFLVSESEKRHKFKTDFLSAINKRTESLNRLERKVDKLLKKES